MLRFLRHPATWFTALLVWFAILWTLSSCSTGGPSVEIPYLDKLAHFTYFFGGGLLFAGWHFRLQPTQPDWTRILISAIIAMALIGWLDEWHQCYTPGRSGADPWDWLADLLGGSSGALTLKAFHRRLS